MGKKKKKKILYLKFLFLLFTHIYHVKCLRIWVLWGFYCQSWDCIGTLQCEFRDCSQRALHTKFHFCQKINRRFGTEKNGLFLTFITVPQDCKIDVQRRNTFSAPLPFNFLVLWLYYLHICIRNIICKPYLRVATSHPSFTR